MNVPRDTGTCGLAEVHAQVQPIRTVNGAQMFLSLAGQQCHFDECFVTSRLQGCDVRERDNHHVAVRIWEAIQDYEVVPGAMHDKRVAVVGVLRRITKHASYRSFRCRNVLVTPGGPEVVHVTCGGPGRALEPEEAPRAWDSPSCLQHP